MEHPCRSVSARVPQFFRSPHLQPSRDSNLLSSRDSNLQPSRDSNLLQSGRDLTLGDWFSGADKYPATRHRSSDNAKQRSGQADVISASYVTPSSRHVFAARTYVTAAASRHYASEETLRHLVSTLEQLKSKDKVISQLERELGHPAAATVAAQPPVSTTTAEVPRVTSPAWSGQEGGNNRMEPPTACGFSPHDVRSGLSQAFQALHHGTSKASFPASGGQEKGAVEAFGSLQAELLGLHDRAQALTQDRQLLFDRVKDLESRNKQLVEKKKRFLEKNVELTAQNRELKDAHNTLQAQQHKLKDEMEESRRRMCDLAREMQRVKGHNLELEAEAEQVEDLKKQIAAQTSSIAQLKQECSEKDRRIELIQHRKKRRRLLRSQEKSPGMKETFYGYDHSNDDDNDVSLASVDSENSNQSSFSVSTISEEDVCDELSREELERNHRQMVREHLQLERSHALLQAHTDSSHDPFREFQNRSQLQADLFSAQCRVELLEKEIRTLQSNAKKRRLDLSSDDHFDMLEALTKERDDLLTCRHSLHNKLQYVEGECSRLRHELRQSEEKVEDLEFRLLELEDSHHGDDQGSSGLDLNIPQWGLERSDLDRRDLERSGLERLDLERSDLERHELDQGDLKGGEPGQRSPERSDPETSDAESSDLGKRDLNPSDLERCDRGRTDLEEHDLDVNAIELDVVDDDGDVTPGRTPETHRQKQTQQQQQKRQHQQRLEEHGDEYCQKQTQQQQQKRQHQQRLEEHGDEHRDDQVQCQNQPPLTATAWEATPERTGPSSAPESQIPMEQLKKELTLALQKYGVKVDVILKGVPSYKDVEQKLASLERMGMEMQKKVIRLQQERDGLEERLLRGAPFNLVSEVERRQNLELKEEITQLKHAAEEWNCEKACLLKHLDNSQSLCLTLKEELEALAKSNEEKRGMELLHSAGTNRTDFEKAGKGLDDDSQADEPKEWTEIARTKARPRDAWTQTNKSPERRRKGEQKKRSRSESRERKEQADRQEKQGLLNKVEELQATLKRLETVNQQLTKSVQQAQEDKMNNKSSMTDSTSSSSDEDDPLSTSHKHTPHKPKLQVRTLERQLQVYRAENMRLEDRLGVYSTGGQQLSNSEEVVDRIVELEDFCTDLQDRVCEVEGQERQMRDKLRVAEQTINDLEASEAQFRDRCDDLHRRERETKRQLQDLQATGRELREIIQDKDIVEQSLREKVEFLEKVEQQSTQRIMDLEVAEKALREQLADAHDSESSGGGSSMLALKEKVSAMEKELKEFRTRNAELEEADEILRENWRRVADEDASRIECLEEKVKVLESLNSDLKMKVAEAQDFVVINSGPAAGSLADELSASSAARKAKSVAQKSLSATSDEGWDSGDESPRKRVQKLKRQLSFLEEEKNSKIAGLQEKLAQMRENEIKLSETLAEMEMTERELRAKLALYESSEVTVEKMLKYQDKIKELRTSQESLLDQLETMETQELTLQERLEETERQLKGKIVTLEVEMKGLKQKENKANARARELEKREAELMEQTKKQAEKENGLYVRISGLMDQLKEHKATIDKLEKKIVEKDERCRKVANLETKFLEIESAYREKVTGLESSLAEVEAMLVDEQNQHEETRASLEQQTAALDSAKKEHNQRVAILEKSFTQRERSLSEQVAFLENAVAEKNRAIAQKEEMASALDKEQGEKESQRKAELDSRIAELEDSVKERESTIQRLEESVEEGDCKVRELEEELRSKDRTIGELQKCVQDRDSEVSQLQDVLEVLENSVQEKDSKLSAMEGGVQEKDTKICDIESALRSRESECDDFRKKLNDKEERISQLSSQVEVTTSRVVHLEQDLTEKNTRISMLKSDLKDKESRLSNAEKQLSESQAEIGSLKEHMNDIARLTDEVSEKDKNIGQLEADLKKKSLKISSLESELLKTTDQIKVLEMDIDAKTDDLAKEIRASQSHISKLETELRSKDAQCLSLAKELKSQETQHSELGKDLREKSARISQLESEMSKKSTKVDQLEKDVAEKECRIGELVKELSDRHSKVAQLEKDVHGKSDSFSSLETVLRDKQAAIGRLEKGVSERDARIEQLEGELTDRVDQISNLESKLEEMDNETAKKMRRMKEDVKSKETDMAQMEEQVIGMSSTISMLRSEVKEKDSKVNALEQQLREFDDFMHSYGDKFSRDFALFSGSSFREKLDFLKEEFDTTNMQLSEQRAKLSESFTAIAALREALTEERDTVQSLKDDVQSAAKEKEKLMTQVRSTDSHFQERLKELDVEFQNRLAVRESEFQQACASLDRECDSLRKDLCDKDAAIERLESNKNELLSRIENLKDKEKSVSSKLSVLEADFSNLQGELKEAVNEKDEAERERDRMKLDIAELEKKLQGAQEEGDARSKKFEEELRAKEVMIRHQLTNISTLEQAEKQEVEKAQALMQQEMMLKTRVSQVEAELQSRTKTLEEEQTATSSKMLQQKREFETQLNKLEEKLSSSVKENIKQQQTVAELTAQASSLHQEASKLRAELDEHQTVECRLQSLIADLETKIEVVEGEKLSALSQVEQLKHELAVSNDATHNLDSQVAGLNQQIELLKSNIAYTESTELELSSKLNEVTLEANSCKMKVSKMENELSEKNATIEQLTADFRSINQAATGAERKERDLHELHQQEKRALEERVVTLEGSLKRHQEEHSVMCFRLQELENREKELHEQITDVEQTVIEPLETENSDLKQEIRTLKQQIEDLNLQIDKQEDQCREDGEELDSLKKSFTDLQLASSETQTKLDFVTKELDSKDTETEALKTKLIDLETAKKNLEDQLENNQVMMDKIQLEFDKETCSRDAQTEEDFSDGTSEAEVEAMKNKLTVLQDAESTFMSRIMGLEEREQQLEEELQAARKQIQQPYGVNGAEPSLKQAATKLISNASVESGQDASVIKVPELFARVQELEATNQQLSVSLEQAMSSEFARKQLTEKLRLLEQSEDKLMERIMELEEREVALQTQLDRAHHKATKVEELEEEVSVLLHQEDELRDQISDLSEKMEPLETNLEEEKAKNEKLQQQLSVQEKQLHDAQKELKLAQTKLQAVRSEYEEKLSASEESEKRLESQLGGEKDLQEQLKVLKEDMEELCERYKELELENSTLKQQHADTVDKLKEAETRSLQLQSSEPTIQAAQAKPQLASLQSGARVSVQSQSATTKPHQSSSSQQPPPQVCSNLSVQIMQPSTSRTPIAWSSSDSTSSKDSLLARIGELEKELVEAKQAPRTTPNPSGPSSSQGLKVLTLREALEQNASLKAQLQHLQAAQSSVLIPAQQSSLPLPSSPPSASVRLSRKETDDAEPSELRREIERLKCRVGELEKALQDAEGAVTEVVTVVRTRSVHTLEQKIETIQRTIHTQSPRWSLHQELLELLTTQADLQKQVSYLMETEHNLRSALKQTEDELARVKSSSSLSARRLETERRISVHSRLSRFGGGSSVYKTPASSDSEKLSTSVSSDQSTRERQEWLERQVTDLQLVKSNLERRLHEAERRLSFKPRPTASSREELLFCIEQLQEEEGEWRKKVEDLQALNSHYLKEKLELMQEKNALRSKLQELGSSLPSKDILSNQSVVRGVRQEPVGRSSSASEGESPDTMLEKPEDVLHKRIKELENLEDYLRQQISELETDREQLHEIARKDKAMIHDQNVRLRELLLQERNLRGQVTALEDSERSLYNRCSQLEDNVTRLEDRVHELEVHERRLRELVRKLKLDEEVWLSRSGDMTQSMQQLSTNEVTLRKTVQDLQLERGGLSDRAEHLQNRVRELESLEASLVQRLKNYENMEASFNGRLSQLEKSEAAAYSKASELDVINMDLSARLQRAVEENAVLSQHVAQQQGQIHQLDRKLTAALDSEVSMSQHIDSLQKHETSLQKKVRENELKEIDAQARIRELEQTEEILKDKVNQLQRSENRLKARLAEFESAGSQMLETLSPAQKQQLPQKLEDCQNRIVVLHKQLEAARGELSRARLAQEGADSNPKVSAAVLQSLQTKAALLEDTEQELRELEIENTMLQQTIAQLRQSKTTCGHEVEMEALKRRLHSYQASVHTLKHHLSEGQVPSLGAADGGQGPESEDLPARSLQLLESERVLHTVRSLTTLTQGPHSEQTHGSAVKGAPGNTSPTSEPEENHWRKVEQSRQAQAAESRGTLGPGQLSAFSAAPPRQEELMIGLSLASESERGSVKSQNDTDSEISGAHLHPHPHPAFLRRVGSTSPRRGDSGESAPAPALAAHGLVPSSPPRAGGRERAGATSPLMPTRVTTTAVSAVASAWPPQSPAMPPHALQQRPAESKSPFAKDDSFYLPSSVASETSSLDGESGEPPPLPSSAPPGLAAAASLSYLHQATKGSPGKTFVSSATVQPNSVCSEKTQAQAKQSSVLGLTIRQRIAQIEHHLKESPSSSRAGSRTEDEDLPMWRNKASENARLLGIAEREGKKLKHDINTLEKDLEEKRRYIDIFDKWILDTEDLLKNKNKKNDRDLVQQVQTEVKNLQQDLANAGLRRQDIHTDIAALRTELDTKERQLEAKSCEVESLLTEVEHWQGECSSVEKMRRNALDSLRLLEAEVAQLQDADKELKKMKDEYNTMRGQYDEVEVQKTKAVSAVHMLRAKVARLAKKCQEKDEMLTRLGEELRKGRHSPSLISELTRLEALAGGEEYNRPLSPMDLATGPKMSETERLLLERIPRWPSSSSLSDPHDLASGLDHEALRRPKSAELARKSQQQQRSSYRPTLTASLPVGGGARPSSTVGFSPALRNGKGNFTPSGENAATLHVAILDYQPDAANWHSAHRQLELPLKEGDQVRVKGPVDAQGYCEAEVGGRTGLVPSSHLYPVTDTSSAYSGTAARLSARYKKSEGNCAEQIVQMFDELQDPKLLTSGSQPSHHPSLSQSTQTNRAQRKTASKKPSVPEAPTNLRIEKVEGSSVVLAWQPPVLDQQGCSNGARVVGYRIYLKGRVCQQPHSPRLSQTTIEGVRHDRPQQLAVQTLASNGQVSQRVELLYQGAASSQPNNRSGDGACEGTDLSSILNSIQYKTGTKRTVMGLYDYDPEKHSPGDFTACELSFRAGDVMLVYGEEREDGFYHGERNGRRGLVAACFVEPVESKSSQKLSPNGS